MDSDRLKEILEKHLLWLGGEDGSERANLSDADLRNADLSDASLRNANLRHANLRHANLSDADLRNANLCNASGNLLHIKSIFVECYPITYTSDVMQIGCERHPVSEWWEFDDKRILKMDGKRALEFWLKWKDHIRKTIEMSPAEPTGRKASESEAA